MPPRGAHVTPLRERQQTQVPLYERFGSGGSGGSVGALFDGVLGDEPATTRHAAPTRVPVDDGGAPPARRLLRPKPGRTPHPAARAPASPESATPSSCMLSSAARTPSDDAMSTGAPGSTRPSPDDVGDADGFSPINAEWLSFFTSSPGGLGGTTPPPA